MSKHHLAISVQNVSKHYIISHEEKHITLAEQWLDKAKHPFRKAQSEKFEALKEVNFDIDKGEVVGIIGRNGAGKSTLLKILSRITEPTIGQIDLYGRIGSLLEVGTGFHPELTGRENIFLNGAILGMKRKEIERQFDAIVAFAEIEKFLDTPVKRYSSGMYVRLAFAVAAHLNPEILIIDEVLAVGDAQFQKKCLGKMKEVSNSEGRTVLFVSHNMSAIRNLCTRVVMLKSGSVAAIGDPQELADAYQKNIAEHSETDFIIGARSRYEGVGVTAKLERITLNNGTQIINGEPLTIRVEVQVAQEVEDLAVGVGFSNVEGVRLMTLESDIRGYHALGRRGDKLVFECQVDSLELPPGTYLIDAGIRSGYFTLLDYLIGFGQVEVTPGNSAAANAMHSNGGVRPVAHWQSGR